jgi:hypothetical protein
MGGLMRKSCSRTSAIALHEQLESLGEMLLDLFTVEDFVTWLNEREQSDKGAIMILVDVKFCKVF